VIFSLELDICEDFLINWFCEARLMLPQAVAISIARDEQSIARRLGTRL
jgi:hypothetical protein